MAHLPGIKSNFVDTSRIRTHYLSCGNEQGIPVLFVHGNSSSSVFWEELMLALTNKHKEFWALAIDQRGYGDTELKKSDATKGFQDYAEDIAAFTEALNIKQYHIIGHSFGN